MKVNYLISLIGTLIFLSSCGTMTPTVSEKREVKNFDWTPPSQAPSRSSDLSIILINPSYLDGFNDSTEPIFKKFAKNMSADFEEALVAKGYSLRGPYETYDEVVFSDKSETDLMLDVEIDFNYEFASGAFRKSTSWGAAMVGQVAYNYSINGDLYIGCKINLVIYESMTREKLWVKSIKLSDKTVTMHTKKYNNIKGINNDPGYLNPLTIALDEYYQQSLKTAWNHLDPLELNALKEQVRELRSKKGY